MNMEGSQSKLMQFNLLIDFRMSTSLGNKLYDQSFNSSSFTCRSAYKYSYIPPSLSRSCSRFIRRWRFDSSARTCSPSWPTPFQCTRQVVRKWDQRFGWFGRSWIFWCNFQRVRLPKLYTWSLPHLLWKTCPSATYFQSCPAAAVHRCCTRVWTSIFRKDNFLELGIYPLFTIRYPFRTHWCWCVRGRTCSWYLRRWAGTICLWTCWSCSCLPLDIKSTAFLCWGLGFENDGKCAIFSVFLPGLWLYGFRWWKPWIGRERRHRETWRRLCCLDWGCRRFGIVRSWQSRSRLWFILQKSICFA